MDFAPRLRDTLSRGFLILDWMEAELIAQRSLSPDAGRGRDAGVLGETALPRPRSLSYQCFDRRITDDAPYLGLAGGEAEEAEGVAAGEFENIGWGEAECLEEAAGVTR